MQILKINDKILIINYILISYRLSLFLDFVLFSSLSLSKKPYIKYKQLILISSS